MAVPRSTIPRSTAPRSTAVPGVAITGLGAISPLAVGAESTFEGLAAGGFAPSELTSFDHPSWKVNRAGQVRFDPREHFGKRNFRPVDVTGQLAIIACQLALDSAGWGEEQRQSHDVGLVLGTMFGSVRTISAFDRRGLEAGPRYVKPLDFANTVITAAAGQTAIWLGLRGTNSTVAGGTVSGISALAQGCELIRAGRASALATGGADELCFESLFGFQQAGLLADADRGAQAQVFGKPASGMVLSEGAALMMLENSSLATARGAHVLGWVTGHGSAFDVSRGRDIEASSETLERAIRLALADAGRSPGDIDAVSSGACGLATDLAEGRALCRVLGARAPAVPVTAVASRLGSALGAAGAFQTQALVYAINGGELASIHGLGSVEESLGNLDLCTEARQLDIKCGLVTGIGLDGGAVAAVIEGKESH